MRHLIKTNFEPLFKNFFDVENDFSFAKNEKPAVNISENEKSYELEFAVPGFQKEDLKVKVENSQLLVSAEQKQESENTEDKKYTRREFSYKSFSRSFYIPEKVNSEAIEAKYENGILYLSLPKAVESQDSKNISIK